jgi:hypothetical protein
LRVAGRTANANATFVPVSVLPEVRDPQSAARTSATAGRSSVLQLVLASGATLRIETGALDGALLGARRGVAMSVVASGMSLSTRVWLAAGTTDIRKGLTGLSALVQNALASNPLCGKVFVFRGRRGDLLKLLWWDGSGL